MTAASQMCLAKLLPKYGNLFTVLEALILALVSSHQSSFFPLELN
jgi:hypothetical protein